MFWYYFELHATNVFWIWISVVLDSLDFEIFMVVGWRFEVEDGWKSGRLRGDGWLRGKLRYSRDDQRDFIKYRLYWFSRLILWRTIGGYQHLYSLGLDRSCINWSLSCAETDRVPLLHRASWSSTFSGGKSRSLHLHCLSIVFLQRWT